MPSALFTPFTLKDVTLRNRVAIPPMCQYNAVDGFTTDWHHVHYPSMARGGAGLVVVEATAVSPEGRITPGCTGLWNDAQAEGMARIAASIKAAGSVPGIQIAHAGRKASANRPWEGDDHIPNGAPGAWQTLAPSAIAFGGGLPKVPTAMTLEDIARVKADFVAAARRARDAGFEWLELHFAHGYLAQSFFSSHSNHRTDQYGGSYEGRSRFLLETLDAVREVWPENLPLTARFGVIEYDGRDEQTLTESIDLTRNMRDRGLDLLHVSIGFTIAETTIPWATPALLGPVSERVRREAELPVATSWGLADPHMAQQLIETNQADLIMIGRAHLANPHYTYHMGLVLGVPDPDWILPAPYAHWLARYKGAGKTTV